MTDQQRIIFITYPGAELLDLTGPSAVFSAANRASGQNLYEIHVAASRAGLIIHSCGIGVNAVNFADLSIGPRDTVLVVGAEAEPLVQASADADLKRFFKLVSKTSYRFGSVCSGVFLLAIAGVIHHRKVATHWAAARQLSQRFESVHCDADALYVIDQNLWTSAGVTTGIDMALAMVHADHGANLKTAIARHLVVYSHRPGTQSQFSDLLNAQTQANDRFGELLVWLQKALGRAASVEEMAEYVGMSPRTFYRKFVAIFNQSPGKFFENMKLESARQLLEMGTAISLAVIKTGFRSESSFRIAFKRKYGVTPSMYRQTWLL